MIGVQPHFGPEDPDAAAILAGIVRTVLPLIEHTGVATAAEVGAETLEQRLSEELVTAAAVFAHPALISAWGHGLPGTVIAGQLATDRAEPRKDEPRRIASRGGTTVGRIDKQERLTAGLHAGSRFRDCLLNDRQKEEMMDYAAMVRRFYSLLSD